MGTNRSLKNEEVLSKMIKKPHPGNLSSSRNYTESRGVGTSRDRGLNPQTETEGSQGYSQRTSSKKKGRGILMNLLKGALGTQGSTSGLRRKPPKIRTPIGLSLPVKFNDVNWTGMKTDRAHTRSVVDKKASETNRRKNLSHLKTAQEFATQQRKKEKEIFQSQTSLQRRASRIMSRRRSMLTAPKPDFFNTMKAIVKAGIEQEQKTDVIANLAGFLRNKAARSQYDPSVFEEDSSQQTSEQTSQRTSQQTPRNATDADKKTVAMNLFSGLKKKKKFDTKSHI